MEHPQISQKYSERVTEALKNCYGCNEHRPTDPCYKDCFQKLKFAKAFTTLLKQELKECNRNSSCEKQVLEKLS